MINNLIQMFDVSNLFQVTAVHKQIGIVG